MAENIFFNEIGPGDWTGGNFRLPEGSDPNDLGSWRYHTPHTSPKMHLNSGWKIHGDFGSRMSPQEAAGQLGLAFKSPQFDLAEGFITVDKAKRAAAKARVDALMKNMPTPPGGYSHFEDFVGTFFGHHTLRNGGSGIRRGMIHPNSPNPGEGLPDYINPLDMLGFQEAMTESGIDYKVNPNKYEAGRHFTAYPQSLEHRDRLIGILERKVSSGDLNLVPQNDPAYRAGLSGGEGGKGNKNHPLSTHIQGRFTTDYAAAPDENGVVDYAKSGDIGPRIKQSNYWRNK
jgi:hypothetical protein